jgi:hypothetical protein
MVNIYRATPHKPHIEIVQVISRYLSSIIDFGFIFISTRKIKHENFVDVIGMGIRILKDQYLNMCYDLVDQSSLSQVNNNQQ